MNCVKRQLMGRSSIRASWSMPALVLAVSLIQLSYVTPVRADEFPSGSYTWIFPEPGFVGTQMRITAEWKKGPAFNETFSIEGLDQNQVAAFVMRLFERAEVTVRMNGRNSIIVEDRGGHKLKKIDGGSNNRPFHPSFDGSVDGAFVAPEEKHTVSFDPGIDPGGALGGPFDLRLPGFPVFTTLIPNGATPGDVASAFFGTLDSAGFPDVVLLPSGTEVEFYQDPLGLPIERIDALGFDVAGDGGNLHVGLEFPDMIPEPTAIALIALGGVIALRHR